MELTDEQQKILEDARANADGDEVESIRVDGPHFFEIKWKRSGYYEGFQTGSASEPLKPAIDS